MALRRLLLIFGIVVIIAAQDTLAADEDLKNIMPLHYTIKITPNTEEGIFYGEYNASFVIYNTTRTITLHSENIYVRKAVLITQRQPEVPLDSSRKSKSIFIDHITPMKKNYNIGNKTFTLIFENSLLHGNHTLNMKFFGEINNNYKGLFKIPFPNDENKTSWILATNTRFTGGRGIFPCLGDSTVKTTFSIFIKHTKSEIALSSMPEVNSESVENDMMWTYFEITYPMSTHEIAFITIPKLINSTYRFKDSVVFWNRNVSLSNNLKYLQRRTAIARKIMLLFEKRFGFKLKVPQIKFIAIPGFQSDPIIASGLVLHREEDIMYDKKFPVTSIVQKNNIRRFVARQVAMQWFMGSLIWSYQWFDAVAEFFGIYALNQIYDTPNMMNRFVLRTVHDSLHLDVDNLMEPIAGQKHTVSNTTHVRIPPFVKVSTLLRMLENILKEQFWSDTKAILLNELLWPLNVWYCFLGNIYPQGCSPIWRWVQTNNYPLITVRRTDLNNFTIQFDNKNMTENETSYYQFPVSISKIQNSQLYKFVYLKSGDKIFESEHVWVPIVKDNQLGYCRVNYENEEMFFTVSLYENLPVLTRAQYIDDEYHLLLQKKKTLSIWYNITQYLNNESDYEAWYTVIRIFEDMSGFLPFSDNEDVISFKNSMGSALDRVLRRIYDIEKIGVEDSFQTCLQYEAFKWACLFDTTMCYVLATVELKEITDSITQERIEQHTGLLQEWMYCNILKHVPVFDLKEIILNSKLKNNFNNTFINYIPCLEFTKVLRFLKAEDTSYPLFQLLDNSDHILLFQSLVAKHVNDKTRDILNNFMFIKPRTMEVTTALCIVINHIYSPQLLGKIVAFMKIWSRMFIQKKLRGQYNDFVLNKTELRKSQIKKHKNNFKKLWNKDKVKYIPKI